MWDCLNRSSHLGCDIVPMANPALCFGGQEVNPTGMIHLLVHFGDKNKFKSLEVDFLVVDVPTAHNVIIGRPTLRRDGDYTSGSPLSSRSSSLDVLASASKGLVPSSSATPPLDKGRINSTSSRSRPFAAARSHSSTKCRPQNIGHPQIRPQGSARPCGGIRGCRTGLAGSPAPWQPQSSPAGAAAPSRSHGPLGPPTASHSVSGIERRASPAVGTPRQPLPPRQRPQPWPGSQLLQLWKEFGASA
ncbi:LOW QUALITY PROTEIN: hypothetical protein Cgig2_027957 [Carnegiea gigantea]|uniref:Uncharacterized protein n=1 Tax=Carnegiea gigantea TaxID=171969 RepID=A0A9Q1Q7Y7_9CARY|nr:LOW QUALITY PROTEIN: hypothetical protein Cgig2_027957 [Carnegiea gigantea]